jgi:hypothetical protein
MSQINPIKFQNFKVVGSFGKEPEPDGSDPNRPENLKFGILGTKNRTIVLIYGSVSVRFLGSFSSSVLLDTPSKDDHDQKKKKI